MLDSTIQVAPAWRAITARRRPFLLGELVVFLLLVKVYDYIRSFEDLRGGAALQHGLGILNIEQFLHLDAERVTNAWLAGHQLLGLLASWWYQFAHVSVTLAVLVWCYLARPDLYRVARNGLVLTNVVGLAVFWFYPVMPPRLLPGQHFIDSVALAGFGSTHGGPVPADQYAAMPSLHLAWAAWAAVVAVVLLRRYAWRWVALCYPAMTAIVVVVTANHYVLDVVAGVGVGVAALLAAGLRTAAGARPATEPPDRSDQPAPQHDREDARPR